MEWTFTVKRSPSGLWMLYSSDLGGLMVAAHSFEELCAKTPRALRDLGQVVVEGDADTPSARDQRERYAPIMDALS